MSLPTASGAVVLRTGQGVVRDGVYGSNQRLRGMALMAERSPAVIWQENAGC